MFFITTNPDIPNIPEKIMIVKFPNKTFYLEENEVEKIPLLKEIGLLESDSKTIDLTTGENVFNAIITGDWFNVELNQETEQIFCYFGIENIPEELCLIDEIRKSFPFSYIDYTKFDVWQLRCHIAFEKSKIEYVEVMNDLVYHPNKNSKYIVSQEYKDFMGKETDVFYRGVQVYTFVKHLIKDDTLQIYRVGNDTCAINNKGCSVCLFVRYEDDCYSISGSFHMNNKFWHFATSKTFFGFFWQIFNKTNFMFSLPYWDLYFNSHHF